MSIQDFVAETVFGQIIDWTYGQIVGFLGDFFAQMGNVGAGLFATNWVQSIVLLFSYLVWALYVTGFMMTVFECGADCQTGRGGVKETVLNAIKDFLAVSLFTTAPAELYKLCVSLQGSLTTGITGLGDDFGTVAAGIANSLKDAGTWGAAATSGVFSELTSITSPVLMIFIPILMDYAIIKVSLADLKRGGTLLIQIAVGSLYMFSMSRGYIDGFVNWSKQVIGPCLTAFLQATVLIAGLMVVKDQALLGPGLMPSAGEILRIVGQFGLDTTTRANAMEAVYVAQGAANLTRTIVQTITK